MKVSDIKIGDLLEIYIRRDGYNYKVISKVEYVDEQRVGVTPIASRTKLFRFRDTDVVDIVYRTEDNSWKWSRVQAGTASLKDGSKLHVFVPGSAAESFNRRNTYRLPMAKDITIAYEILKTGGFVSRQTGTEEDGSAVDTTPDSLLDRTLKEISESYSEETSKAFLKDLSEGGAAILSDAELKKGDIVSFELPFGQDKVSCRAVVMRVTEPDKRFMYAHGYGLSYIETSRNYMNFFVSEQRRMLNESRYD